MNGTVPKQMRLDTARGAMELALRSQNSTAGTFGSARSISTSPPTSTLTKRVFESKANLLLLLLLGSGASNNTVSARIIGWSKVMDASGNTAGYVPTLLAELQGTITDSVNGTPGVTLNGSNDHLADAITIVTGDAATVKVKPGISDIAPASAVIDTLGFELVEIELIDDGSAASANALYREL